MSRTEVSSPFPRFQRLQDHPIIGCSLPRVWGDLGGSGGLTRQKPSEIGLLENHPRKLLTLEMVYYVYSWLYHMTRICGGPQGHSTQTPRSMSGHMVGAEAQAIPPAARNAYFRAQTPCRENRIEQVIWVCKIGDVRAVSSDERPVDLGYTL